MVLIVPDKDELIWKSWSGSASWVVYHPRSGQTHFVDELSASVLRSLVSGCCSCRELADTVLSQFDLGPEASLEAIAYVERAVQRFSEVGLVDRSQP